MQWLKLQTNILDDDKINVIRAMPEGDSLFVLWIGLLCIAMQKETDKLYIATDVPYTIDVIARQLRIDRHVAELGLQTFEKLHMVDVSDDGAIEITNLGKHQSLDSVQRNRELTASRMRRYREKLLTETVTPVTRNAVTCLATDIEIDKDIDKNKNTMSGKPDDTHVSDAKKLEAETVKQVIDYLNHRAGTHFKPGTKAHASHIKARIREGHELDDFKRAIVWCVAEWREKPEMEIYIRPDTIFSTKMSGYIENYYRKKRVLADE